MATDDFREWFSDYGFGYRGARGNRVADALAAIDMVLAEFSLDDLDAEKLGCELAAAIRPFAASTASTLIGLQPELAVDCPRKGPRPASSSRAEERPCASPAYQIASTERSRAALV